MRVDVSVLSDGFAPFAALGKISVRQLPDSVEVADDPGGEVRFYIRENDSGMYVLSRADRSEDEDVIMWSPDAVDLERYLTRIVGVSARQRRGLARLAVATDADEIADCFSVEVLEPGVVALRSTGGELLSARFRYLDVVAPIIQFAQVAGRDPATLREAYLDPEGKPLFTLRTKPYRA